MQQFLQRLQNLQKKIASTEITVLSNPNDIAYFTGFLTLLPSEREAILLVTTSSVVLLHAAFSPVEKFEGIIYHPRCSSAYIVEQIKKLMESGRTKILIDPSTLFVEEYQPLLLIEVLEVASLQREIIWELRHVKDAAELEIMKQAASLTRQAYGHVEKLFAVGVTEKELAFEIEFFIKKQGGELGFPSIVAFGEHGSLPHHQPTDTALTQNTAVLIDLGAKVAGYSGDMTRTVWFGNTPDPEFLKIEKIVRDAYDVTFTLVQKKRDATAADFDLAARTLIDESGFGNEYIHTTGHGLGLDVHESPSIYKNNQTKILPNMVITIEPGIYLPGKFGYRYENTVLITSDSAVELTK